MFAAIAPSKVVVVENVFAPVNDCVPAKEASVPAMFGRVTTISAPGSAAVRAISLLSTVEPSKYSVLPSLLAVSVNAAPDVMSPTAVISPPAPTPETELHLHTSNVLSQVNNSLSEHPLSNVKSPDENSNPELLLVEPVVPELVKPTATESAATEIPFPAPTANTPLENVNPAPAAEDAISAFAVQPSPGVPVIVIPLLPVISAT